MKIGNAIIDCWFVALRVNKSNSKSELRSALDELEDRLYTIVSYGMQEESKSIDAKRAKN